MGSFPPEGGGAAALAPLPRSWTHCPWPQHLPARGRLSQDDQCTPPHRHGPQSGCPAELRPHPPLVPCCPLLWAPGQGSFPRRAGCQQGQPVGQCQLLPAARLLVPAGQPAAPGPALSPNPEAGLVAGPPPGLAGEREGVCLANLASRCGLQDDFTLHPPNLLLLYNLSQVQEADCRAFIRCAAQGDVELLSHLPDQRVALRRAAVACLVGAEWGWVLCIGGSLPLGADLLALQGVARPRLSASDLQLLGALVCDMDASSIGAADPRVLENLQRCPRLTAAQHIALNSLLAGGKTSLGPPGSWTLEGLQALGPLATYISPHLWAQVQEAVGLGFFRSVVASCRAGRLSRREARRFVTSFLESKTKPVSSRPRLSPGNITAATLRDDLLLVHYDCAQLESCLDGRILRTNLDPLLQHPLPTECQRMVKAKLAQIYPQGLPEDQLRLILYSHTEIGQWSITSQDTVVALLASDVALENQTEAVLQKFLEHNSTVSGALLLAIGGTRLCWMSPQQIQTIHPQELRLAGALDVSSCPQSRKNVLYTKAREDFGSSRTPAAYYRLMRPYLGAPMVEPSPLTLSPQVLPWWSPAPLTPSPRCSLVEPRPLTPVPPGGAPVEELRHLAQANISMDIDTFTSLNPLELQSLDVGNVTALLGHNVGDLQKARSHPTVRAWLHSLNSSALGQLGLDASPAGPAGSTGQPTAPAGPPAPPTKRSIWSTPRACPRTLPRPPPQAVHQLCPLPPGMRLANPASPFIAH
ncbi:MSLNL isoform 2 [Pongo abelii]|uniref:MSLNL isoform 2 n=1 Tax=Pongo abelii TaxID=9601 RepID=A0A2J8R183_PONAB|nr:MSLNL isoform 2 [Pongo abelii]